MPWLQTADIAGLRKVFVDVSWEKAVGREHLQMSTYIADTKLDEK
jgi:hypothetical protein